MIIPIEGYESRKRDLLCGELVRYSKSLEWVEPNPGGSLLDLGACGDLVPVYQGVLGFDRVACLDMTGDSGDRRLVHRDGSVYEFEAHRANLETEPYPLANGSFDQVVAMEVLEHLAVDPMFMLAEANRVLKQGGKLLLTTPNIVSLTSLYLLVWGRHPSLGRQAFGPGTMDRHHREYTPVELREILQTAGFDVEQLDTFDTKPPNASVRRAGKLLRLLSWFKPDIDLTLRGCVIRCACVKTGEVGERFPESIYPRYSYFDYGTYDRELEQRFGQRKYWRTNTRSDSVRERS